MRTRSSLRLLARLADRRQTQVVIRHSGDDNAAPMVVVPAVSAFARRQGDASTRGIAIRRGHPGDRLRRRRWLVSEPEDWAAREPRRSPSRPRSSRPTPPSVAARRIRLSAGLLVQTTIMALLGPGPAVAAASGVHADRGAHQPRADAGDDEQPRRSSPCSDSSAACCSTVIRELVRHQSRGHGVRGARPADYILLAALNLLLVIVPHPTLRPGTRRQVLRESVLPSAAARARERRAHGRHRVRVGTRRARCGGGARPAARGHDPARTDGRGRAQARATT